MTDLIVARNGGWVLASNGLSVASLRGWGSAGEVRRQYPPRSDGDVPITDEEVAACEAWTFPPIHDTADYEGIANARCRCGQWFGLDVEGTELTCAWCGRRYRVRLEEVTGDGE